MPNLVPFSKTQFVIPEICLQFSVVQVGLILLQLLAYD